MRKIGILYICTGKYEVFWEGFYDSVCRYFLNEEDLHFFVWTDSEEVIKYAENDKKIHIYYQEVEQWPYPTLKRFEYFLRAKEEMRKMDYLIFMNANLIVNTPISREEVLPGDEERLFFTLHPGFFDQTRDKFTYDENNKCRAYIGKNEGERYYAGGFNGGCAQDFIELMECLSERINADLQEGIIARWHDESHINRYIIDCKKPYRVLSPAYLYPQGLDIPFEEKITVIDKNTKGGHAYLRE